MKRPRSRPAADRVSDTTTRIHRPKPQRERRGDTPLRAPEVMSGDRALALGRPVSEPSAEPAQPATRAAFTAAPGLGVLRRVSRRDPAFQRGAARRLCKPGGRACHGGLALAVHRTSAGRSRALCRLRSALERKPGGSHRDPRRPLVQVFVSASDRGQALRCPAAGGDRRRAGPHARDRGAARHHGTEVGAAGDARGGGVCRESPGECQHRHRGTRPQLCLSRLERALGNVAGRSGRGRAGPGVRRCARLVDTGRAERRSATAGG